MKRVKTPTPIWYRILFLVVGIIWIIWLSIEDSSERGVLLFSVTLCALLALRFVMSISAQNTNRDRKYPTPDVQQSTKKFLLYPIIGAVTGLAVTPIAIFMMALKTGLHGHITPDFSSAQVTIVLIRTPIWIIGGLLIGVGMSLISWSEDKK